MRSKVKSVVVSNTVNQERNAPQVVLHMVGANREDRCMRFDRLCGAHDGARFCPFNVHLDQSWSGTRQRLIEWDTGYVDSVAFVDAAQDG